MTLPWTSRAARTHAAGEVPEPEAERAPVEIGLDGAGEEGLELAQPAVLASGVSEIVTQPEAGGDRFRGPDGQAFVDEQFAQAWPAARSPSSRSTRRHPHTRRLRSLRLAGEV